MSRVGYLKTVAFLAAPRKLTLLLLAPVPHSGLCSSDEEESATFVDPVAPGRFILEEALLAPHFFLAFNFSFFFFFSAARAAFISSSFLASTSFLKRQNSDCVPGHCRTGISRNNPQCCEMIFGNLNTTSPLLGGLSLRLLWLAW